MSHGISDETLRLDSRPAGSQRSSLRCAHREPESASAERRPAKRLPAGLRSGSTWKLHSERYCGCHSVRSNETEVEARLQSVTALHLLQRASDGAHGELR